MHCQVYLRYGPPTISQTCRRSIFAKDLMLSLRHSDNPCWPKIMYAMLANQLLRCSQPILMWPKMRAELVNVDIDELHVVVDAYRPANPICMAR